MKKVLEQAASFITNNSSAGGNLLKVDRFLEICNEDGYNMLHTAIIHKKPEVIETILLHGNRE